MNRPTIITLTVDETAAIAPGVTLMLVAVGGGAARIGVEAPRSMRVDRAEITARLREHEREAAEIGRAARRREAAGVRPLSARVRRHPDREEA